MNIETVEAKPLDSQELYPYRFPTGAQTSFKAIRERVEKLFNKLYEIKATPDSLNKFMKHLKGISLDLRCKSSWVTVLFWLRIRQLERLIEGEPVEHAIALDVFGNVTLYKVGDSTSVSFTDWEMNRMKELNSVILIHNHPGIQDTTVSCGDIKYMGTMATELGQSFTIRAVTPRGYWFSIGVNFVGDELPLSITHRSARRIEVNHRESYDRFNKVERRCMRQPGFSEAHNYYIYHMAVLEAVKWEPTIRYSIGKWSLTDNLVTNCKHLQIIR